MVSKIGPKGLSIAIAVVALWGSVFVWLNVYGYAGGYSSWRGFPFPYYTLRDHGPPFSFRHPWAVPVNTLVGIGLSALIGLWVYRVINAHQDLQAVDEKLRSGTMHTGVTALGTSLGASAGFIVAFVGVVVLLTGLVSWQPDAGFVAPLWSWAPALASFLVVGMPFLAGLLTGGVRILVVLWGAWLLARILWQILLPEGDIAAGVTSMAQLAFWYYGLATYWLAIAIAFIFGRMGRLFVGRFIGKSRFRAPAVR